MPEQSLQQYKLNGAAKNMPRFSIKQQVSSLLKRTFTGRKDKAQDSIRKGRDFDAQADKTLKNAADETPERTSEEALCTNSDCNAGKEVLPEQDAKITEPKLTSKIDITSLTVGKTCIKANLTKTSKKDAFGNPRYDNLDITYEGDIVKLEYMDEAKTYLVLDKRGNELGEIGAETTSTILKSSASNIAAVVSNITGNEEGKYFVQINVYV
jgi:hypothetical protein